ncbi:MAG: GYF domain-containing protein [Armatimonadota bacterium]
METYEWYYVGQFGQLGPLSLQQVQDLIDGGVITAETYVWRPGMSDWTEARHVPDLSRLLRAPATPPPFEPGGKAPKRRERREPRESRRALSSREVELESPYDIPSPRSRLTAGILQLLLPGVGRMYLGYAAIGVLQLFAAICTCSIMWIWSLIDGVVILAGGVRYDGYGRVLKD